MSDWNTRYEVDEYLFGVEPNTFLVEASGYLPAGAHVVSLGEGEGRNGVWLAEQGRRVTAVDGSSVGLAKAERLAAQRGVQITPVVTDLAEYVFPEDADAILSIFCHMSSALRRAIYGRAKQALRPGGIVIIEAYHPDQVGHATGGPSDRDRLVTLDDLRSDWEGVEVLLGRELVREVQEGIRHTGLAAVTQFVARAL